MSLHIDNNNHLLLFTKQNIHTALAIAFVFSIWIDWIDHLCQIIIWIPFWNKFLNRTNVTGSDEFMSSKEIYYCIIFLFINKTWCLDFFTWQFCGFNFHDCRSIVSIENLWCKKNGTFNFFFGIELEMCNGMGMGMHSKKTMWFYERKKATHSKGLLY